MDRFYDTDNKSIGDALRSALSMSRKVITEIKDAKYKRVPNPDRDASSLLEELLSAEPKNRHLVFILRTGWSHVADMDTPNWECGGCTMGKNLDEFLFIYLEYEQGLWLVEHYGLTERK